MGISFSYWNLYYVLYLRFLYLKSIELFSKIPFSVLVVLEFIYKRTIVVYSYIK